MGEFANLIKELLRDILSFCLSGSGLKLRSYQVEVARAVADSVMNRRGLSFVVVFPRQSGKNELQAQLEAYLLTLYSQIGSAEIVKASPTWKPQSLNAMRRLERVLKRNFLTSGQWTKEQGYIYRIGSARITFLSGAPTAQIVGATASHLLEVDEAQDVQPAKYDKDLAPMAASTNATRVFWGTAWTSRSLLGRELRAAQAAERQDGIRRSWVVSAEQVGAEVPAYRKFVAEQVARMGRQHPLVKTQFFSEEIDAEGGLFPPARLALICGQHPPQDKPASGGIYAFLLDVAGEDETQLEDPSLQARSKRDSTALTIVECDLASLADELVRQPTYRVVSRQEWLGEKHPSLFSRLRALVDLWQPRYIVVDATGIGAGLASFLDKALPGRVLPFIFTLKSKSDLGWQFIAAIESGRFKDYALEDWKNGRMEDWKDGRMETNLPTFQPSSLPSLARAQATFLLQLSHVQYTAGENRLLRWSVPDGTRDPESGALVHDDYVMSAALVAVLDGQEWSLAARPLILQAPDPLTSIDQERY